MDELAHRSGEWRELCPAARRFHRLDPRRWPCEKQSLRTGWPGSSAGIGQPGRAGRRPAFPAVTTDPPGEVGPGASYMVSGQTLTLTGSLSGSKQGSSGYAMARW